MHSEELKTRSALERRKEKRENSSVRGGASILTDSKRWGVVCD
jgi:hypothetical protein